jgi:hypothetical protein
MRDRWPTLLLALLAWFMVPAAPRAAAAVPAAATISAATAAAATAVIRSAPDPSERRVRFAAPPVIAGGAALELPTAASAALPNAAFAPADAVVARTHISARPRGPPLV